MKIHDLHNVKRWERALIAIEWALTHTRTPIHIWRPNITFTNSMSDRDFRLMQWLSLSLPFILWISLTQRNNRMTSLRSAFHKCSHVNVANNRAKERRIKRSGGKWSSLFVYVIFFFRKSSQNTKLISIPIFTSFLPFLPLCRNVLSTPPRHGWCLSVKETPALVLWTNINQTKPKSNQMNFCRNHLLIEIYCDLNLIADGRKQNTHTHTHYPNWPIDEKTWI